MKKIIIVIIAGCALAAMLGGCATPVVTPGVNGQPGTTNYVPNQTVSGIATIAAPVASALPPPWGTILTGALGLLTIATTTIAGIKNKQLTVAQGVHDSIIEGIEAAGTAAAAIKTSVATTALRNGNADAVQAAVKSVTAT